MVKGMYLIMIKISSIKKIILYCLFKWYRNGNRIIVHKQNGKISECIYYFGLTVRFKGKNSVVEIYEPILFKRKLLANRSKIKIGGDSNNICFNSTNMFIHNLQIGGLGSNNRILFGNNYYQSGLCSIDFCGLDNMEMRIGDNCMFGQDIKFMLGDHHSVIDINTNKCVNAPRKGINIGNHVWIARNVRLMKNVTISDNTIVGADSVVTKEFKEQNCIIAGVPAKVVKNNVNWDYKNTK